MYPNRFPYTQTGNLWVPEDRQIKDIAGGSTRTPLYLEDDSGHLAYLSRDKPKVITNVAKRKDDF